MASADLPQNEIKERVKDLRPDSDDEEWIKVGWTRKELYLNNNDRDNNEANTAETDPPTYTQVSDNTVEQAEEPAEIEETARTEEQRSDGQPENAEVQSDDSDGVSVITESDLEQHLKNDYSSGPWYSGNSICGPLRMWDPQPDTLPVMTVQTTINTVLVCFVGVLIGMAASRIFSMIPDTCPISSTCDLNSVRSESDRLINHIKELTEVKSILNEIKATMPQKSGVIVEQTTLKEESFKRSTEEADSRSTDNGSPVLKQLRVSLNTLYGALNNVKNADDALKSRIRHTEHIITDLTDLQRIMLRLVKEMDGSGRPVEAKFWQSTNDKMIHVSETLLYRLSYTLFDLTENINNKLSKIRCNLNKKLCYLRNTLPEYEQLLGTLDEDNKFLEMCNTIVHTKCGKHENLDGKKVAKKKDLKNMENDVKKNVVGKSEKIARSTSNDFVEFLTGTLTPKDTCPVFSEPFTYAEVVSGKHLTMVKESKKNYPTRKQLPLQIVKNVPTVRQQDTNGKNGKAITQDIESTKHLNNRLNESYKAQPKIKKPNEDVRVKKMKNRQGSMTDFLRRESIEDLSKDYEAIKKRKTHRSSEFNKKMKNRVNETAKNSSQFKSKSYVKKYPSSEDEHDAEWQFRRSHSREERRMMDEKNTRSTDGTNWYFGWMDHRKNSRSDHCKTSCDVEDSEDSYRRQKREKKSRKFRKND